MVNLDQAQKNVRNAQDQLDQALKELEKAKKKPEVWEQTIHDGCLLRANRFDVSQVFDYPCKVTVRPLGGPALCEEIVCGDRSLNIATQTLYRAGFRDGDVLRIAVELA